MSSDAGIPQTIVVGMGASAGGLEAFSEFLRHMPANSGMGFVLVQHLDPNHPSIMPELLAKDTSMSVRQVQDEMPVEPDHVYVIPPNATMSIEGGVLRVSKPAEPRGRRMAIDAFFGSLAEDLGHRAVCIVLSGTGSDGTLGLRAIKEHGGLAMAQSTDCARYDSMPRSAIATRLVDYVLPAREMPAKLLEYARHVREHGAPPSGDAVREEDTDQIGRICSLLHRRTGHDFSQYKKGTVMRRLQRRMRVLQVESLADYLERLREEPREADELFRDLLISVTHFFRDPEAFAALQLQVLPQIVAGDDPDRMIRIWVPGCATGEEAYSIAMLSCEFTRTLDRPPRIQIFATDIDEQALEFARVGRYPEGISEQVSPERLQQFFERDGNAYVVSRLVREMCIFSPHNVIKDPPFSSLDLISCRNLLIYLENDLQRKLLPVFHYALRPGRFLLLGPTENIAAHSNLFRVIDKKSHLYQSQQTAVRPPIEFPLARAWHRPARQTPPEATVRPPRDVSAVRALEHMLLEDFAPASVVINARAEIAYFIGRTGKFLAPQAGVPSNNLLDLAREGLKLPLRTAIYRAVKDHSQVVHERVMVQTNGHVQPIRLTVRPMREVGDDQELFVAIFQEMPPADAQGPARIGSADDESLARQIDLELRQTREHLQATIEEMEAGHEELKSSNEELLSMNEELQSSNEQLQTSKEELQSVNEELGTVNAELNKKVEELDRANSDLQNLFQSTRIATVFLDGELRIKRFTPAATEVFNILDSDIGRRITDFAPRFAGVEISAEVNAVLRTLVPHERHIHLPDDDRYYSMRLHPYRTVSNVIAGVVMTFVDVTAETKAQMERARLAAIVESSRDSIIGKDLDGRITSWNSGAEKIFGYSAAEAIGQSITLIIPPDHIGQWMSVLERLRRGDAVDPMDSVRVDRHGQRVDLHIAYSLVRDGRGQVTGVSSISRDIRPLKLVQAQALQRASEVQAIMEAVPAVVWISHDRQASRITGNPESYRLLRLPPGSNQSITAGADERPKHFRVMKDGRELTGLDLPVQRASQTGEAIRQWENEVVFDDGLVLQILGNVEPLFDASGNPSGAVAAFIDITELKRSREALDRAAGELRQRVAELEEARRQADEANHAKDRFLAILSHELRTPLTPVLSAVQMAARDRDKLPLEFHRTLDLIERNVVLEARLIDDLLDFNRLSTGALTLRPKSVNLGRSIGETVEICQPDAQRKDVQVRVDTEADVWVHADPARLRQIIWNLLRNAIQHSAAHSVVSITARHGPAGTGVLEIVDAGEGIDRDRLPSIFEPFERGKGAAMGPTGLGLGLSICKSLVELQGGTIEAQSEGRGRGARFAVTLPAPYAAGDGAASPGGAPAHRPEGMASHGRRRVLFVEDNPDTAEVTAMLLRIWGLDVTVCASVAEAEQQIGAQRFDVIISDIGLPDGNGCELLQRLREAGHDLPAIAMSGFGMEEDVAKAKAAGFAIHLTKPVDIDGLESALADMLGLAQRPTPPATAATP